MMTLTLKSHAPASVREHAPAPVFLRPGTPDDAVPCGQICFDAFKEISGAHNFPPDFPSPAAAAELALSMLSHPGFYSVVAVLGGHIVGSNFLDCRGAVAGVGPITVASSAQNRSIGRLLMNDVDRHAREQGFASVRLVQAAYHGRSLSLYAKLGFEVREPLACLQGPAMKLADPDCAVRPATVFDIETCNHLCRAIHRYDRGGELRDAVAAGTATVAERQGRITGYATAIAFFGHAVGESNRDLQALIGAATSFAGPGILVPLRNSSLFRWCLERGLKMVQPLTLMSRGDYQEPEGVFLPSILY